MKKSWGTTEVKLFEVNVSWMIRSLKIQRGQVLATEGDKRSLKYLTYALHERDERRLEDENDDRRAVDSIRQSDGILEYGWRVETCDVANAGVRDAKCTMQIRDMY